MAVAEERLESEQEKLDRYRLSEFLRMGFTPSDAEELTAAEIDVHSAERLLHSGCPHHYAVLILL